MEPTAAAAHAPGGTGRRWDVATIVTLLTLLIATAPASAQQQPVASTPEPPASEPAPPPVAPASAPDADRFECLRAAYPEVVDRLIFDDDARRWMLALKDGQRLVWDDGRTKTDAERLEDPDVQDMLHWRYPLGPGSTPPRDQEDPGRPRHEPLLKALYGADAQAVYAQLERVPWFPKHGGKRLKFHRAHGAAAALARVATELEALPPTLRKYMVTTAGTYNWRTIRGTDRLSVHSFGAAIDLNVKYTHYWKWSIKREPTLPWRNQIPLTIVEVFERHGFIWGGKWHHYDTMHFEYRPELLHPNCSERREAPTPR